MVTRLLPREWVELSVRQPSTFRITSWNILADGLDRKFEDRPEFANWEYRRDLVMEELRQSDADIVALCEVNRIEFLEEQMKELGYTSHIFNQKSKSVCQRAGVPHDGSAIFFRPRFTIQQDRSFAYHEDTKRAAAALVKDEETNTLICVAMTHLTSGSTAHRVRTRQIAQLIMRGEMWTTSTNTPLIFCGDWNDPPGGPVEEALRSSALCAEHGLLSAYTNHAPPFTCQELSGTWNTSQTIPGVQPGGYQGVLDYIYYSSNTLKLSGLLEGPSFKDTLAVDGGKPAGIPNRVYPSDHISLTCDLSYV